MGNDLKYGLVLGAVVLLIFVGYYAIRVNRPKEATKPPTPAQRTAERSTPNLFEPPAGTYAGPVETGIPSAGNIAIFEPTTSDTPGAPVMTGQTWPPPTTVAVTPGTGTTAYRPQYVSPQPGTARVMGPGPGISFPGTTRPVSLDLGAGATKTYKIQDGDTLGAISKKFYGTDDKWQKIIDANKAKNLDPKRLVIGTEIIIPDVKETPALVPGLTPEPSGPRTASVGKTHTVAKGDTLYSIAKKYYNDGTKADKIFQANKGKLSSPDRLQVGMVLTIP
jgi:nucleoid-associated protein YgaU